ncbi:alpha/beta fold hydrolase [Candidatus Parcubacteria bacterium]|jgi:dipeptidyl aminopeptidase/acylaminoacyl peptidase|nr:MAG: alpha/beta fold hydrolase [Candidatus Parcubacteria bacterium]
MKKSALYFASLCVAATIGAVSFWLSAKNFPEFQDASFVKNSGQVLSETRQAIAPQAPHPVSYPALFAEDFNGSNLEIGEVLARTETYTRYYITYASGDLTISGIMNVPKGDGPFPALVLNHGHIDTDVYTNGRGLRREQDFFARNGFVVLHTDYRNHAQSSKDNRDRLAVRFSYAEDAINAVYALRRSGLSVIDTQRIGMLGHSMGGGVTLGSLVTIPDLIDAAVLYAPVSGDMRKSFERWMDADQDSVAEIASEYGLPEAAPEFWANISAETFYGRIRAPVHIYHGTTDDSVPLEWSKDTLEKLRQAGVAAELTVYPAAPHEFTNDWPAFMNSALDFFKQNLKS